MDETALIEISGALAVAILILRQIAEIIGKSIPDSATGWRANVRQIAKIISGYVKNKP